MADRVCVLGCTVDDVHFAACPWFGVTVTAAHRAASPVLHLCGGCVPVVARPGVMVCASCYRRLRRHVDEAPDLVALLRSRADPTRSGWNWDADVVSSSRVELPAPVSADLLDASDDIVRTLREWALLLQFPGQGWRAEGLEAGADAEAAYEDARGCADVILDAFDTVTNRRDEVQQLAAGLLTVHDGPDRAWWSVADALRKWPVDDRPRWAKTPCPECDMRMVRVVPARGRLRFVCQQCEWTGDSRDAFLAEQFVTHKLVVLPDEDRDLDPERVAAFIAERREAEAAAARFRAVRA